MDTNILRIRDELAQLEIQVAAKRLTLQAEVKKCHHTWTKPKWCGKHIDGYQDQGDPVGTMGIDRRLPCWIPAQTIDEWERTCTTCGEVQKTKQVTVEKTTTTTPKF